MSHSSAWCMDKILVLEVPSHVTEPIDRPTLYENFYNAITSSIDYLKKPIQKYNAYNAQHCNQNNILLALPKEMLKAVVSQTNPLKDGIKTALTLRSTCKHFYTLPLEYFGEAYRHHDKTEKNKVMKELLWNMGEHNYWNVRNGALLLIYAGADNNADELFPLLRRAIYKNDTDMITILFKSGANPNQKILRNPNFYDIKTIDIAKIFTVNKVDWNTEGSPQNPNVLWYNIFCYPSSKLIEFYLNHHVDAKKVASDGNCLLHYLVSHPFPCMYNIDDYIKIGALLLKAAPEMVDRLNNSGKTPIEVAQKKMENRDASHPIYQANKQLISLFEEQIFINKIKNSYPNITISSKE